MVWILEKIGVGAGTTLSEVGWVHPDVPNTAATSVARKDILNKYFIDRTPFTLNGCG